MQTLVLVVSRFQVSVVNRQYEKSRWSLVAAAVLLMIHYGLQMACGFRAHSDDAGTIVNILFYTPATFLVAHSMLNLECEKRRRRRYDLLFGILLVATFVAFGRGWLRRTVCTCPTSKWCCTPSIWCPCSRASSYRSARYTATGAG